MGVVHHSVYYNWYEMGRTEWMREQGFTYEQCEAEGCLLPLVESGTKYLSFATYDDLIELETVYCPDDKGISFYFEYTVRNLTRNQTAATGFTRHVCVNREFRIDRRAAKKLKALFQ
jgi:acyl-CoA thioester hydrolase